MKQDVTIKLRVPCGKRHPDNQPTFIASLKTRFARIPMHGERVVVPGLYNENPVERVVLYSEEGCDVWIGGRHADNIIEATEYSPDNRAEAIARLEQHGWDIRQSLPSQENS
jgi:hypothetical protein